MVDRVIVTVVCGERSLDMEFPANVPMERIEPVLITGLRTKGIFLSGPLDFVCNGQTLQKAETLFRSGVWDGGCLEVQDQG